MNYRVLILILTYFIAINVYADDSTANKKKLTAASKTDALANPDPYARIPGQPTTAIAYPATKQTATTTLPKKADSAKFYTIAEFVIPENFQLHIKIWKDGKESEEYYEYIKDIGIKNKGKIEINPLVAAMCYIKYGTSGSLIPFLIDLNFRGKGLTDLPNCEVTNGTKPLGSLSVSLPDKIPQTNI